MTAQAPILSLRGIRKSYGPTEVLHGVDFDVHPGEVVALLGENGAGKSTLSGIVAGSIQPSTGEMTWLGQPYAPADPRGLLLADRRRVAFRRRCDTAPPAADPLPGGVGERRVDVVRNLRRRRDPRLRGTHTEQRRRGRLAHDDVDMAVADRLNQKDRG